jgi:tripartite-type tricarboxylate transporter receptor subunit TctC
VSPIRRRLLKAATLPMLLPAAARAAEPLPLLRLLLGAPAGGVGDVMARRLAARLRGPYAGNVIVENRPGAGGQLAVAAMKDVPPDGSTLLLTPSSLLTLFPYTYRKLPYDAQADLQPLALVGHTTMAFAVGPAVPESVRSLADYLQAAGRDTQLASYGSPASGSMPHLLVAALAQASRVPLTHVPYRGSALAVTDLRGGTLPALCSPLGIFLPYLASGAASGLRLLAVTGEQRSTLAPEVPTLREMGHKLAAREWYGFFASSRTPAATAERASAALLSAMNAADLAAALAATGLELAPAGPARLAALMQQDATSWRELVRQVGFSAES